MKKLLEQLLYDYIQDLEKIRNNIQINPLKIPLEFNTSDEEQNKTKVDKINEKNFIVYIISTKEELTFEEAKQGYDHLKKNGFGAFRVKDKENEKHFEYWAKQKNKKCLYVGSSQDIKKRLKEHLGIINDTTYALHLAKWWKNKKITVELYEANNLKEMQLYEDLLWDEYKPLLGRKGRK